MKKWSVAVVLAVLGCSSGSENNTSPNNNTNTAPNNTAGSNNTTGPNNTTSTAGPNNTTSTTGPNNTTSTTGPNNTTGANLILPCEQLDYGISCSNPQAAAGYPACSDYFGDITGVEVSCSANPVVDVGTTPCQPYEFYVGSCVYYTEALPTRCYITHVGADSADLIAAGRTFWSNPAVCANWVEGP